MPTLDETLDLITQFYVESHDFNGIPVKTLLAALDCELDELKPILAELIETERASAVFGETHPNPHIRALPDHPPESQRALLFEGSSERLICLYPTPKTLEGLVEPALYADRPFTLMLALGQPQLKHLAFDLSVLETYRNDPRYNYMNDDVSGRISVSDEYYRSSDMSEADKVLLHSFGFAYDEQLNRAVAVFLRDLAHLSPAHQQIWRARLLAGEYRLHPDYYRASILGEWPDRISIFEAFVEELVCINAMCSAMGRPSLFRDNFSDRPRGFGAILRPTANEFNDFVHLLDKMMSENINRGFFQNDVSDEQMEIRKDSKVVVRRKGTIQMLEEWFTTNFCTSDPKPLQEAFDAFRKVRRLRQKPAHAVSEDLFDSSFIHKQRLIIEKAYDAVRVLRLCLADHPRAKSVEVRDELKTGKIWAY